jgi:hypothetical protein
MRTLSDELIEDKGFEYDFYIVNEFIDTKWKSRAKKLRNRKWRELNRKKLKDETYVG